MEKRIEEMAKDLCECYVDFDTNLIDIKATSVKLFDKGYRKASEVAEEIFAEIIEALVEERIAEERKANSALEAQDTASYEVYNYAEDKLGTLVTALSLYKKKYTETEGGE